MTYVLLYLAGVCTPPLIIIAMISVWHWTIDRQERRGRRSS